jgi:hypothetical protein
MVVSSKVYDFLKSAVVAAIAYEQQQQKGHGCESS